MSRCHAFIAFICLAIFGVLAVSVVAFIAVGHKPVRVMLPTYQHAFVIVLENHGYTDMIGNPNAPQINRLAQMYGVATHYYGVTHPSEPNYVALIGGSYFGIQDDEPYSATIESVNHTIHTPNLADQLPAAHLTWKSYQQSLPYPGYTGPYYPSASNSLYVSKHDPFLNFADIQSNPARLHHLVPDTQLLIDLHDGTVPTFSFISPDLCHDMHGGAPGCPKSGQPGGTNDARLVRRGDDYVGTLVQRIMGARLWSQGNNAIVITSDESDTGSAGVTGCCRANSGGGRVATIVITSFGERGVRDNTAYNHYSLLRTLQDIFHLGCLQNTCDMAVKPMTPLFAPRE